MEEQKINMEIGQKVQTMIEYSGVPKFTEGYIVEDYGTGMTVAWDLPDRPYPKDLSFKEVAEMYAVNPKCPLRDGFDKETELSELVKINA